MASPAKVISGIFKIEGEYARLEARQPSPGWQQRSENPAEENECPGEGMKNSPQTCSSANRLPDTSFFFRSDFLNLCIYVNKEAISYLHRAEAAFCLTGELLLLSVIIPPSLQTCLSLQIQRTVLGSHLNLATRQLLPVMSVARASWDPVNEQGSSPTWDYMSLTRDVSQILCSVT